MTCGFAIHVGGRAEGLGSRMLLAGTGDDLDNFVISVYRLRDHGYALGRRGERQKPGILATAIN